MGYNIGLRLIDEFLAKSGINACQDFRDTCEVIAKVGGGGPNGGFLLPVRATMYGDTISLKGYGYGYSI